MGGFKWGLMICYDLRFPELSRTLALQGAEVLAVCSAWPLSRISQWEALLRARAIENQAYVIGANRTGRDRAFTFGGTSLIIDPLGNVVSQGRPGAEELLTADIENAAIESARKAIPVFEHRRPDLY
jgi:predicted amidohydrolase